MRVKKALMLCEFWAVTQSGAWRLENPQHRPLFQVFSAFSTIWRKTNGKAFSGTFALRLNNCHNHWQWQTSQVKLRQQSQASLHKSAIPSCAPITSSYVLTLMKVQKRVRCSEYDSRRSLKLDSLHKGLCAPSETWNWFFGCFKCGS